MALAIDASSPAAVLGTNNTSPQTQTTASFTPPANSLLVVIGLGDSAVLGNNVSDAVTDNLGAHLTYTQRVHGDHVDSPSTGGSITIWTAPVVTSAAMTVSYTHQDLSSASGADASLQVFVMTDGGNLPTVGNVNKVASVTSISAQAVSITATATGSWTFGAAFDWDAGGTPSAGSGCTGSGAGTLASNSSWIFLRRTTADGVNGSASTLNVNYAAATANSRMAAIEIVSGGGGGGGATPTASRAQPGQTWRRHFQHRQIQLPDPPVVAAAAPNFVPTAMVRRRWNRRMLPLLPSGSVVSPVGAQSPPPRPRTVRVTRRRFPYAAYGPDSFSPPAGQVRVPPQNRRRLLRPRLPVDGDSYSPPPNQQAPVVNPPITQMVTRALRRWGLRRVGSAVNVVPIQQAAPVNPSITQVTSGRVRRIGVLLRRPGVAAPTTQQGHVHTGLRVQSRRAGFRFARRPQIVSPTVQQGHVHTGLRVQPRRGTARFLRRRTIANPVPTQQAAPTNPPITQLGSLWAKRWGLRRYGRVANPVPVQQAAPTNPAITALTAVRARVGARALRRGKAANPTPVQQAVATAPPLTQLTAVRGRAVVHGAPRRPQAAAPPIPQATPPAVTVERRGLLRVRRARARATVQPPPQAAAPPQVGHRPPRLRRMLRRLGFPIQGGTAPTSTAVSTVGSLGATATDLGSVSGPDGTGGGAGSTGLGGVAGADEIGRTGGSGMTGSAQ